MNHTFPKSEIIEAIEKCITDKELRKERYPLDPYIQYPNGYTWRCDDQEEIMIKNMFQKDISELKGMLLILGKTKDENITLSHQDIALFAGFIKNDHN